MRLQTGLQPLLHWTSTEFYVIVIFAGVIQVWHEKHKDVKIAKNIELNVSFTMDVEVA